MKHLGDITKISGYDAPVVDCIIGGSPCQDLSVAGLRAGLEGQRSGLFMEQIRIVKEMRENDRRANRRAGQFIRPRFMVWENVEGAFSSPGGDRKGEDFRAVLTEIVRVVQPEAPDVPLPDGRKWSKSGVIMGNGADGCPFSIAWRLHDAQFWGVPQRRKRIALVADFGGLSAPEICFERKGLSWNPHQGGGVTSQQSQGDGINEEVSFTLNGLDRHAVAYDASGSGGSEVSPTIVGDHNSRVSDTTVLCMDVGFFQTQEDCAGALLARQYKDPPVTMFVTQGVVMRLTPLECERLQGFPDHWTDIGEWVDSKGKKRKCTDGARYKALGNSIALPFWFWLLRRISAQYERPATMASLFDGIGGFPLCWERCNGPGTAIWASEIEEFPIAVTKRHFPEVTE